MTKLDNFVNLHLHTDRSLRDGIGTPRDVIESMLKNGMNAGAVTEHGNFNSLADFYLVSKELKFKPIFGQEFYWIPSIHEWHEKARLHKENKAKEKKEIDEDDGNGAIQSYENEDETRSKKKKNPLKYYGHLILIAQSIKGLKNLFQLNNFAHRKENFYYFPRIDFEQMKKYSEDVVCLTACTGGVFAREIARDDTDVQVEERIDRLYQQFSSVFNDRLFLEVQFNNLDTQHVVNNELIKCAKRNNAQLVATADSHYPYKDWWKEREIVRAVAFNKKLEVKSEDDLRCLLYPKNAEQMFEDAKKYCSSKDYWNEDLIKEAINNSAEIEKNLVIDYQFDRTPKLSLLVNYKEDPYEKLKKLCKEGLDRLFSSEYWQKNNFDKDRYIRSEERR